MVAINLFCPECVAELLKLFTYCGPACFVPSVLGVKCTVWVTNERYSSAVMFAPSNSHHRRGKITAMYLE